MKGIEKVYQRLALLEAQREESREAQKKEVAALKKRIALLEKKVQALEKVQAELSAAHV